MSLGIVEFGGQAGAHLDPGGKECGGTIFNIVVKGLGGIVENDVECRTCGRVMVALPNGLMNPQPPDPAKKTSGRFELYRSTRTFERFSVFIAGKPAGEVFLEEDKWSPGSRRDLKFDTWEEAAEAEQR